MKRRIFIFALFLLGVVSVGSFKLGVSFGEGSERSYRSLERLRELQLVQAIATSNALELFQLRDGVNLLKTREKRKILDRVFGLTGGNKYLEIRDFIDANELNGTNGLENEVNIIVFIAWSKGMESFLETIGATYLVSESRLIVVDFEGDVGETRSGREIINPDP
ncbi:MAG: hypothetical protein GVY36_00100 [Verrucomicrobia bacterium]|jgi:hypothetical protein|nr:hypothetical protein [Verrucomicrobiota bacterium]